MATAIAQYREQLRKELADLKTRIEPPSSSTISTKAKMFTFPDGSSHAGPLSCVVLDWRAVNTYYTGVYDPANPKPPACWAVSASAQDMGPQKDLEGKKADSCSECAFNVFGSAPVGKGKACKNTRRLAIAPIDADESTKPWFLNVSPTGITSFESLILKLEEMGHHSMEALIHIGFNKDAHYPQLVFSLGSGPIRLLTDEELGVMLKLRDKAQAELERGFGKKD